MYIGIYPSVPRGTIIHCVYYNTCTLRIRNVDISSFEILLYVYINFTRYFLGMWYFIKTITPRKQSVMMRGSWGGFSVTLGLKVLINSSPSRCDNDAFGLTTPIIVSGSTDPEHFTPVESEQTPWHTSRYSLFIYSWGIDMLVTKKIETSEKHDRRTLFYIINCRLRCLLDFHVKIWPLDDRDSDIWSV